MKQVERPTFEEEQAGKLTNCMYRIMVIKDALGVMPEITSPKLTYQFKGTTNIVTVDYQFVKGIGMIMKSIQKDIVPPDGHSMLFHNAYEAGMQKFKDYKERRRHGYYD